MSINNIGDYDMHTYVDRGKTATAGKPTTFAPTRGKFIPPNRVAEQRRQAVGVGGGNCFYHGSPPLAVKSQYAKSEREQQNVVVANTKERTQPTVYQKDFTKSQFDREEFQKSNSPDRAFGKVPHGGFIKFHDVETRAQTGSIPDKQYNMVYSQQHQMGAAVEMPSEKGKDMERPTRRGVNYEDHVSLGKARERANMRTLNFAELPGQDLNPKPMRKGHEEYGQRHKVSQITWAYHG